MRVILRKVKNQEWALFTIIQVIRKKSFCIKVTSSKTIITAMEDNITKMKIHNMRVNFLVDLDLVKELMRLMKLNMKVHG